MCVDCFHIVSLFLSNPCTPSKEAFVYFVCPTEIPQPPFAWKYYDVKLVHVCILVETFAKALLLVETFAKALCASLC